MGRDYSVKMIGAEAISRRIDEAQLKDSQRHTQLLPDIFGGMTAAEIAKLEAEDMVEGLCHCPAQSRLCIN
jgi:hypothetical protein